jgi:hypothetical protein
LVTEELLGWLLSLFAAYVIGLIVGRGQRD